MINKIDNFRGEYYFLSNFYNSKFTYRGLEYLNAEAAFQSMKCIKIADRKSFTNLAPNDAKKLGRRVRLRDDWEDIKYTVMEEIVYEKFNQNLDLQAKLLNTGNAELIEGNTWGDTCWGICNGVGKNMLGQILMRVRTQLK